MSGLGHSYHLDDAVDINQYFEYVLSSNNITEVITHFMALLHLFVTDNFLSKYIFTKTTISQIFEWHISVI